MKLFLKRFGIIGAFIVVLGTASGWTNDESSLLYLYETKNYSFQYPSEWKIEGEDDLGHVRISPPGEYCRICGLKVFSFKAPFTTQKYTDNLINNAEIYNYTIINSEDIVFDNYPAHKLVYEGKEGNQTYKWLRVYVVKDYILYDIIFTAKEDEFNNYIQTVNKIIESFVTK